MIYIVSKIFTAFFLPPGLFITILAASAFFAKKLRWLLAAAALFLYGLSIHPIADRLLAFYEAPFISTQLPDHADAVVTLGGGNRRGTPIPLMDESFKRAIYGLSIAKKMDIPVIVSGNGEDGYNEFLALLDSLETLQPILKADLNVSDHFTDHFAIIGETKSHDTYENAQLTMKMIGKKEPVIVVVTSAYHMKRALALFRLAGAKNLYPAATNFYTDIDKKGVQSTDLFPSMWALLNSYRAMHEFFGSIKVKLREMKNK
ncbi:YdcF family protein [Hydrogenimonas cancrithermarum]|uniref:DUF218 domain-containing protein n=1 Tax=Hydrogenimonas cancrithermarum TaxID=2993563 RepID=A0ABN6WYF7_9BACT|nr:YdcF family protein [Hydrogenimonas cancrithermarum]BDY13147.1 hypothetical protein HCR_14590 [Hydrogenimonas cancrithermarum]